MWNKGETKRNSSTPAHAPALVRGIFHRLSFSLLSLFRVLARSRLFTALFEMFFFSSSFKVASVARSFSKWGIRYGRFFGSMFWKVTLMEPYRNGIWVFFVFKHVKVKRSLCVDFYKAFRRNYIWIATDNVNDLFYVNKFTVLIFLIQHAGNVRW